MEIFRVPLAVNVLALYALVYAFCVPSIINAFPPLALLLFAFKVYVKLLNFAILKDAYPLAYTLPEVITGPLSKSLFI